MNKIFEYDYVRAIATLLVILGHCTYYNVSTDYGGIDLFYEDPSITFKILSFITGFLYTFHMPLFIALSGSLWRLKINQKQKPTFKNLLQDKYNRLIIPFLLTSLLWSVPLKYISGYWQNDTANVITDILIGQFLMLGNSNSHLWFLQALFWIFLFSHIIEQFQLRHSHPFIFIIALTILSIIGIYCGKNGITILNISNAFLYLFWFYIGFYFEHFRSRFNLFITKKIKWWHIFLWLSIDILGIILNKQLPNILHYITYFIFSINGMAIVYIICVKSIPYLSNKTRYLINKISSNSYGLYLYSDPINYIIIFIASSIFTSKIIFTNNTIVIFLYLLRFIVTTSIAFIVIRILTIWKFTKQQYSNKNIKNSHNK